MENFHRLLQLLANRSNYRWENLHHAWRIESRFKLYGTDSSGNETHRCTLNSLLWLLGLGRMMERNFGSSFVSSTLWSANLLRSLIVAFCATCCGQILIRISLAGAKTTVVSLSPLGLTSSLDFCRSTIWILFAVHIK